MSPPLRLHLKRIECQNTLIIMVCRDEQNVRWTVQVTDFKPYFYVARKEEKNLKKKGLSYEPGVPAIDGTETFRVFTDTPAAVPKRRKGFSKTWEADVPYTRRFLVDTGIHDGFELHGDYKVLGQTIIASTQHIKPVSFRTPDRTFLWDIETNKPEGSRHYSSPLEAAGAVTCYSYYDTFDEKRIITHFWHPERGTIGRPKLEVRSQWSDAFQQEIEWRVHTYGSEEEMHVAILQYLKQNRPDIMDAWNGSHGHHRKNQTGFDVPYVINRLKRIGLSPTQLSPLGNAYAGYKVFGKEVEGDKGKFQCSIDGVQLIDGMTTYQIKEGGFTAQVPFSDLKRVTEKYTGKKMKKDPSAIEDWWLNNTEQFLTYSFNDVDALVILERSEHFVEWARDMQQFVGVEDTSKIFAPMALITTMILRIAKEDGVCIPTAGADDADDYEAEGGYVIPPRRKGLQKRVGVADLNMMYVNTIISGNLSPETHVPKPTAEQEKDLICVPSDLGPQFFLKPSEKEGLLPKACKRFKALRERYDVLIKQSTSAEEIKKLKQARQPAKQLLLGVWGTSLSPYFALYKPEVGSSILGTGRFVIQSVDDFVQRRKDFVTYGDTDSSFVPLPGDGPLPDEAPIDYAKGLVGEINQFFNELTASMNMDVHSYKIGFELMFAPFVMGHQKKMYAGYVVWQEGAWQDPPVFLAAGIPGIKSDAAPITRETSEAVLKAILNGVPPLEILEYIRGIYDGVMTGAIGITEIIRAVGLNVDLDDPKTKETNIVRGARHGRALYDFEYPVGSKVRVVKLRGGDEEWISIPDGEDLPKDIPLDLDHHAQLAVLNPLEALVEWVDLETSSIKHGTEATVQRRL